MNEPKFRKLTASQIIALHQWLKDLELQSSMCYASIAGAAAIHLGFKVAPSRISEILKLLGREIPAKESVAVVPKQSKDIRALAQAIYSIQISLGLPSNPDVLRLACVTYTL